MEQGIRGALVALPAKPVDSRIKTIGAIFQRHNERRVVEH
jgi:hypothetical protein